MSDRMKFIKKVAENLIDKGITTLEGDYEYHAAMAWIETITQTHCFKHGGIHQEYVNFIVCKSTDADFANLLLGVAEPQDFLVEFYGVCMRENDKNELEYLVLYHHRKMSERIHDLHDPMRTEESEHKYFDDKYDR